MSDPKYLEKVAIIGAGGHVGNSIVEGLLKTGKHTITAVSRLDSKSKLPEGVKVARVDYNDEASLVSAFRGQDVVIITLGVQAAADTHTKLVKAAADAGVKWILPNVWGNDIRNIKLGQEDFFGAGSVARCEEVKQFGSNYIATVCGFWYEWSLALGEPHFGIDIANRKAVFFDDGKTVVCVSTWEQCGRAVSTLLSLPVSGASPALEQWKNEPFYFRSFRISQRDMLDSVHRVMGTTDKDWEITYENSEERVKKGAELMKQGQHTGFARAMYTRNFYPNGDGDFETSRGTVNKLLGLPQEDLDAATKRAVDMATGDWKPW